MTRAAELIIQALLPRKPAPVLERQTGLPYGWGLWLRARREERGVIARDKSEGVVLEMSQRPAPPAEAAKPALGFWSALRSLFYQQWDPPLREERPLRWFASSVSATMHLLFVLLLLWVAVVRLPPPPEPAGDGSRVQVEFIGRGTPQEEGGGAPAQESSSGASAPASSSPAATASADSEVLTTPRALPEFVPPSPTVSADVPQVREREVSEPTPPASQPVQVSETPLPEPQTDYVLPPPTMRRDAINAPTVSARDISVQEREVTVIQTPQAPRVVRDIAVPTPTITRPVPQVQEREIAAPLPQVRTVDVPSRVAPTRDLQAPSVAVREREVAAPRPAPTTGNANQPSPSTNSGNTSSSSTSSASTSGSGTSPTPATGTSRGTTPSTAPGGTRPGATAAGPGAADRSGGWNTPVRGDDWGASNRNVAGDSGANAGQSPGLFNADGSVRLPGSSAAGDSTAGRGAPGGDSDQWTNEKIDRSGTWLQRPPYGYDPSSFEKYWVPNESLLAEWVRKNIRETTISIPGTNKKIRCVISVLQLGGGCGLSDPNLNEQPASARPPPEIPVKRNPIPTDS